MTIGKSNGAFKLKITNALEPGVNRELEFTMTREEIPNITKNTTGYIFRVFNDDYIKENLEGLKYKPDGEIEGYILGKEKIDLSKEKAALEKQKSYVETKEKELKEKVLVAIKDLDDLSIRKNTTEYQNVNFNNLFNPTFGIPEGEKFADLINQHNQLKALPDNLPDLKTLSYLKKSITTKTISDFISESYTKSNIAEEFKTKIKGKQDFIEIGIKIIDYAKNDCPFCEQNLEENSLKLIDQYLEYLAETEAQQIKKANDLYSQLRSDRKEYNETYKLSKNLELEYIKNQKYIPSLSDTNLIELQDLRELDAQYRVIQDALEKKKEDIATAISNDDIKTAIENIESWVQSSNEKILSNTAILKSFNDKKNNISSEKLELNKRLCRARFNELKIQQSQEIQEIINCNSELKDLQDEILQKEQNEKISKKQKVVETFVQLLTKFFGDKYSFDDTTFCLKFKDHLLESNAGDVLSNGEKVLLHSATILLKLTNSLTKKKTIVNSFLS